jgi:hypothetical protein
MKQDLRNIAQILVKHGFTEAAITVTEDQFETVDAELAKYLVDGETDIYLYEGVTFTFTVPAP